MDRERDRDRRPGGERYAPGASTYRPGRSSPPRDSYRSTRSPPPRRPPPAADTYVPASSRIARPRSRSPSFRRRSRSPRGGYMRPDSDTWRRPRSPPRREYSPRHEFSPRPGRYDERRDARPRSPPREFISDRYDRRSPPRIRERSPPPLKRSRDVSPVGSRGRSPPPAKRERLASPLPRASRYEEPRPRAYRYNRMPWGGPDRLSTYTEHSPPRRPFSPPRERNYRPRSRSPPPREDRVDPYGADTWRRRSPSLPRFAALDGGVRSGRESVASSRRSSPPVHPSRLGLVVDDRPTRPTDFSPRPRSPYRPPRSPLERERSPPRREPMPIREPLQSREREYTNGSVPPPSGPRNGDFFRVPPTGPAGGRYGPAMSPPAGPSMSAHSRNTNPILSAPSRPRGGGRGSFGRDYPPYEPAPMGPRRGSGPWGGRGSGPSYHGGPPSGPRGGHHGGPAPFRGSANSTSTTYPRTQRFNTTPSVQPPPSPAQTYLNDVPAVIPGGQKQKDLFDPSRLTKLEDEAKKLRDLIAEKEAIGRRGKREWDRMEREGETASLRADLADEHLRNLNGESMSNAAF
ncbi:hypothetical protein IWZ00DRAFT_32662 [Phyllosticta capitalensis]